MLVLRRAYKLKVLNLSSCTRLIRIPNLSDLLTLERLILDGYYRWAEIDSSIGELKNLIFLSLGSCREVKCLPKELGGLPSLTELLLIGASIQEIPNRWALNKLENPNAHESPAVKTLGSINLPTSLSKLSLVDTHITHLPDSIGALTSLERSSLSGCRHVNRLPHSIGELRSLTKLDLSNSGITNLPDSMESLENLKVLKIWGKWEPRSIFALPTLPVSLTSLAIVSRSLVTIPDLSNLINLKLLMLFMGMSISSLKFLYLFDCLSLPCIPQISSSVSKLHIERCRSLTTLDISNLKNLSELYILDSPVEDPFGRELPDNLLEWKIEKNRNPYVEHTVMENLIKMVFDGHSFLNI